jgi:hypothetical protein
MIEIDQEGGSGKAVTGGLRFRNDWPGLFIRGDECGVIFNTIMYLENSGLKVPDDILRLRDLIQRDVLID